MLKKIQINKSEYKRIFCLSDIHGNLHLLDGILEKLSPGIEDLLIIAGDSCDRGSDTMAVYDTLFQLVKRTNMIHLIGNHERMFYDYIVLNSGKEIWFRNGGEATLKSYNGLEDKIADHIDKIADMPYMVELDEYLIVHAGIDFKKNPDEQTEETVLWGAGSFIKTPNTSGKTIVFGHIINDSGKITFYDNHTIGIDTGTYKYSRLGALELISLKDWYYQQELK